MPPDRLKVLDYRQLEAAARAEALRSPSGRAPLSGLAEGG
jgi:hypothetical protein